MIFLGTPQLRGGVNIFFFYKVSFEKHPNVHFLFNLDPSPSKYYLLKLVWVDGFISYLTNARTKYLHGVRQIQGKVAGVPDKMLHH